MRCVCGKEVAPTDKFCPDCGTPLASQSNSIDTGGGHNYGSQFVAGRDIHLAAGPQDAPEPATYQAISKWRSPFTQGVLAWISVVTGISSLLPVGKALYSAISSIRSGSPNLQDPTSNILAMTLFVTFALITVAALALRRIAKLELRIPIWPGWAISGLNHRLVLEKIEAEKCPICKGYLRYKNKAIEWNLKDKNGHIRRQVTKRSPALECKRNPEHWFKVDPAEDHSK